MGFEWNTLKYDIGYDRLFGYPWVNLTFSFFIG